MFPIPYRREVEQPINEPTYNDLCENCGDEVMRPGAHLCPDCARQEAHDLYHD